MAGDAKFAAVDRTWKFTIRNFAARAETMLKRTSSLCARDAIHFCIVPTERPCPTGAGDNWELLGDASLVGTGRTCRFLKEFRSQE